MRPLTIAMLAIASTYGLASSVHSQETPPPSAESTVGETQQQFLISANNLAGATLLDQSGEEFGTVNRIALSRSSRTPQVEEQQAGTAQVSAVHLVTDVGGVLGIGAREIAIPLAAVRLRPSEEQQDSSVWLSVNIAAESLKQAPVLEARDSLELTDAAWVEKNARFYGVTDTKPANVGTGKFRRPLLTTEYLIDKQVVGQGDTATIAYLDDLLFGFGNEPIKYAILGYGGALGLGKDYVAIPFKDITITERGDDELELAVPYNSKTLSEQQHVTPEGYPELKLLSVRNRIEEKANK